jgi:hypothetical protein
MTKENLEHLEAIQDIRQMMKKSTRFLSLSGLSGVFAGIFALLGAAIAYVYINYTYQSWDRTEGTVINAHEIYFNFILIALSVLVLSISTAYFFSNRKAKREGHSLFDHTAKRALINLAIPLFAGGVFCLSLMYHGAIVYIAPAMLLFYGLALINASKYTYDDIRYFGICQIILGLINSFNLGNGLIYWALGFGILHIVYGTMMWIKYDRKM